MPKGLSKEGLGFADQSSLKDHQRSKYILDKQIGHTEVHLALIIVYSDKLNGRCCRSVSGVRGGIQ